MAKKTTLYIEDTEIKLLTTSGNKVEKWASFVLEPSLVSDGAIIDEEKVAAAIKDLLKLQKVSSKNVTVALSGLNSIFRIINLPDIPAKMIPEAILNEASRVIPMPLEEVYLAHQKIPTDQAELSIFLAAYPRKSTDSLLRTVQKAGLNAGVIDLAPLALARCVNERRAILVNSWLTNLDIVILIDRLPQVVRSMSLPGEDMSSEEKVAAVVEEFNRTVSFYNTSHKEHPLDTSVPVYACGDLTQDEAMWQSLNLNMGDYNVSSISPPVEAPEMFIPCQYMINIGLALKNNLPAGGDNQYSIIDFNCLPESYRPVPISWYRILVPVVAVAAIAGLVYFWFIIQDVANDIPVIQDETAAINAEADLLRSQIEPIRTAIAEQEDLIEPLPAEISALEDQIDQTQQLADLFDETAASFTEGLQDINSELPEILLLKPAGVTVQDFSMQTDNIVIKGIAIAESEVYDYARSLRSSERFNSATVNSITESTQTSEEGEEVKLYSFEIAVQ